MSRGRLCHGTVGVECGLSIRTSQDFEVGIGHTRTISNRRVWISSSAGVMVVRPSAKCSGPTFWNPWASPQRTCPGFNRKRAVSHWLLSRSLLQYSKRPVTKRSMMEKACQLKSCRTHQHTQGAIETSDARTLETKEAPKA